MSPIEQSASKKSSKRPCTNLENFRSIEADMAFNDYYKKAPIIMERVVAMETLENTFILEVFKERTWTKLLNPIRNVYVEIIREFFANAFVERERINCWLRGREFSATRESIQEILELHRPTQQSYIQYDDRLNSLVPITELLGGDLKKKVLNIIPFTPEIRTLAYIMLHNLYLVKNLTTLFEPRTIFLLDLFTHKEIDICSHIFYLFTKCVTKRNSRLVLPFPSLVMALIARARGKVPSGLPVMQRDYPINAQTMTRSKAHITGPSVGISQIPRDDVEEEGGNMEEEIDRFILAPEGSTQPSSKARARAPDRLNLLIARVEQMYGMLESHVQNTSNQFTYIEG